MKVDFEDQLADIFAEFMYSMSDDEEAQLLTLIRNELECPWKNIRICPN